MTTEETMTALSAYYGETYSGIVGAIVKEYLDGLSNSLRTELFRVVVRKVSRSFGKAPDVAAFEDAIAEAYDHLPKPDLPRIEERTLPTAAERAEVDRLLAEAAKTPAGKMLLGVLG